VMPAAAQTTWAAPAEATAVDQAPAPAPEADQAEPAGRLGFLERRKLGLTFRAVLKTAKELKADGQLDTENPDIAAAQVTAKILGENPQAFEKAGVDWEAILAFIEAIVPLILQFMALI